MNDARPRTVVFVAPWPWEALYNRSQPLALALARRGHTVYYVQPRERAQPPVRFADRLRAALQSVNHGYVTVTPGPHANLRLVEVASQRGRKEVPLSADFSPAAQRALGAWLRGLGGEVSLLSSRPQLQSVFGARDWTQVMLDLEDPWLELSWGSHPYARATARSALHRAELIFSNGESIAEAYRPHTPRPIHGVPNGVEASLLATLENPGAMPEPLRRGTGKFRVLFTGKINNRIHFNLLAAVLPQIKDVDFHFVGEAVILPDAKPHWQKLLASKNCFHVPPVPATEVGRFLAAAHGFLLPYSEMGGTRMFPAKLFEYIAAARPIFAPQVIAGAEAATPAFLLYRDAAELKTQLEAARDRAFALPESVATHCRQLARDNTWDRRAETVCALWDAR